MGAARVLPAWDQTAGTPSWRESASRTVTLVVPFVVTLEVTYSSTLVAWFTRVGWTQISKVNELPG